MSDHQDNSGISAGPGRHEVREAVLEAEVERLRGMLRSVMHCGQAMSRLDTLIEDQIRDECDD